MRVRLHGLLDEKGGAAKIAGSLERGLALRGVEVGRSCEMGEAGAAAMICPAKELGGRASGGEILHLHGSADFGACLSGLAGHRGRVLITLHDCRLFTAGCPFPLECGHWREGCADCPRGYGSGASGLAVTKRALANLEPVIAAPSRWMARLASEAFPGANIRVVPNGVAWPDQVVNKREAKRVAGLDPESRCVMFAAHGGTSAEYKAGDTWLDIWRAVQEKVPGAVGIVAGGDKADRDGNLVFWPYLQEEALRKLMRAADVFAYPTRADNHPLLVLEAMSEATPSLAYNVGGVPEQINDRENGFLVPKGNRKLFVRRLVELLERPAELRNAGRRAYESGRARFSEERMVEDYLGLYGRLWRGDSPAMARSMNSAAMPAQTQE